MRTLVKTTALLTALAPTLALLPAATAETSAAPYCGQVWGSTVEWVDTGTEADLTGVRAGRHECFDRLVVDLGPGPRTGYWVGYVPVITQDGSGTEIPTRGGAALQVLANAPAYDDTGHATYAPATPSEIASVAGFRTFRQVVWGSSFEGNSTIGIGVRARLPFRAFTLAGPGGGSRLVVDVAHLW